MRNDVGSAFFNVPGGDFVDEVYVLDMAFFDERSIVVVYRLNSAEQGVCMCLSAYVLLNTNLPNLRECMIQVRHS